MSTLHRSIAVIAGVVLAAMLVTVSTASFANPPPGKGNPNQGNQGNNANSSSNSSGKGSFDFSNQGQDSTLQLVTAGINLVAARQLALDTGTTGYKPLPPGIAKNLARGKPLPPGIANRNLPDSLLQGLPKYPGYQWTAAGADLVLVNLTSRLIADVLVNALR